MIDDNLPAFPFGTPRYDGGNHYLGKTWAPGMSLRDYFAGQILANTELPNVPENAAWLAANAYMMADAMLTERKKDPK